MHAHYLSHHIQNEFINICSSVVKSKISEERSEAKYYSIMVDATPDVSHDEQHSFVIRYLSLCVNKCEVKERFLGFLLDTSKTGEDIFSMVNCFVNCLNSVINLY